jgi:hypothetical protein
MRTKHLLPLLAAIGLAGCTDAGSTTGSSSQYLNALTGEVCIPNRVTMQPRSLYSEPQPLDCIGKHIADHSDAEDGEACCEFPQPGCDATACCEADLVVPEGPPVY